MASFEHYQNIYNNDSNKYHELVSREDCQRLLLPTLESICHLPDLHVVEFGAGTGRLTRLLAPKVMRIQAFDAAPSMLETATRYLSDLPKRNWSFEVGENHALPINAHSADLAVAGWTFGHLTQCYADTWRQELDRVLAEVSRVLKPSGTAIIIETFGTGTEIPAPPSPVLAEYYSILESKYTFQRKEIRTDYQFESVTEAESLTRFFFGNTLADRIQREQLTRVPECTGIWYARGIRRISKN